MEYKDLEQVNAEISFIDIKGKRYADVANRVKAFRKLYPNGCILTKVISIDNGVCVMCAECRDEHGSIVATGHAYEKEDSSFINKTSYIENCETSAVGRALGFVGIGVDNDIFDKSIFNFPLLIELLFYLLKFLNLSIHSFSL